MNTHVACPIRSNACPQISTIPRSQPFQCDTTACQVCQCFTSNISSDASFIVSSFSIATNVSSFACRTQNFLLLRCLHRQNSQQSFLVAKLDTQRIQMVEQIFFFFKSFTNAGQFFESSFIFSDNAHLLQFSESSILFSIFIM